MLFVGRKRWFFQSPGKRFASNEHLSDWLAALPSGGMGDGLQCEQYAGDVMLVPAMWAHAVANVCDSVAVATELSDCLEMD